MTQARLYSLFHLVPAFASCQAARHSWCALMQAHLQGLVRLPPSRQIQHTLLSSPGRGGAPAAAAAAATAAAIELKYNSELSLSSGLRAGYAVLRYYCRKEAPYKQVRQQYIPLAELRWNQQSLQSRL
jgi:hypothetical protein